MSTAIDKDNAGLKSVMFIDLKRDDHFMYAGDVWCKNGLYSAKCLSGDWGSCSFGRAEHPETHKVIVFDEKIVFKAIAEELS